jgi:UDP-2,3-diacylglucosamine pyrophosphatase LpxH
MASTDAHPGTGIADPDKRFYRSVWISDVHLCTRDSRSDMLYRFLDTIRCDYLFLVGDIFDLWALKRKWYWPPQYNEVLHKLLKRSRKGARVIFLPGNHDEFFRSFAEYTFGAIEIAEEFVHETADGRRLLVLHGDKFDTIVLYHRWLSVLGSRAYNYLILVNRVFNKVRRWFGLPYFSLSGAIKRKVQSAINYVTSFEDILTSEARRRGVDGVICGHIHQPLLEDRDGLLYGNTGDWVENCTALVESETGELELIWWHSEEDARCRGMAEQVLLERRPAKRATTRRLMPLPAHTE